MHCTVHYGRTSVTLLKYDKIGLKIVALGSNLLPFCRHYENVINLTLPITLVRASGFSLSAGGTLHYGRTSVTLLKQD